MDARTPARAEAAGRVHQQPVAGPGPVRLALLALAAAFLTGCGGSSGGGGSRLDLMLDFFPNADHAAIYAAQATGAFKRQGVDVRIRTPSDPSAPLKLLAAGKADLAISYEPEVLRARDKGLPVVAVGSLVRTPLTSIISLPRAGVPTYDELVITANERDVRDHPARIRHFLAGLEGGVRALKADPEAGIRPLLAANRTLDPRLQRASVRVTLPYFAPAYMDPKAW